jgi:hypothetical protein
MLILRSNRDWNLIIPYRRFDRWGIGYYPCV